MASTATTTTAAAVLAPTVLDRIKLILRSMLATVGGLSALGFLRYLIFLIQFKSYQRKKNLPLPPGPTPLPVCEHGQREFVHCFFTKR